MDAWHQSRYSRAPRMKKNRVFFRGPALSTPGRAVVPTKPWPCATCVTVKSAVTALSHPKRSPPPKEAASTLVNVPRTGARLCSQPWSKEAVELRLGNSLQFKGNIVTQLKEGFEAAVRDELRGIKTAAEQAPAVSAHFGHQQRSHGVLSIGGDQRRERRKRQRLQPRHRKLHFAEIDPAVEARRKVLSVLGGAEAAETLAEDEVKLIDCARLVGRIRVRPEADAAHAIVRARRFVRHVEERAAIIAPEPQPADVEIALALANDGVAQSGFGVGEAFGPVVQELELFRSGAPEAVACGGEVGQAFAGQDLPVIRGGNIAAPAS